MSTFSSWPFGKFIFEGGGDGGELTYITRYHLEAGSQVRNDGVRVEGHSNSRIPYSVSEERWR